VDASSVIKNNLLPDQNDIRVAHVQGDPEDKKHEKEIKKIEEKIEKAKEDSPTDKDEIER